MYKLRGGRGQREIERLHAAARPNTFRPTNFIRIRPVLVEASGKPHWISQDTQLCFAEVRARIGLGQPWSGVAAADPLYCNTTGGQK